MITKKQRSLLSSMGQKLEPIFQIGKNGITDVFLDELESALEKRELVKISVRNDLLSAKEVLHEICEKIGAEPISQIGFKIVLYKQSSRKDIKHIEI